MPADNDPAAVVEPPREATQAVSAARPVLAFAADSDSQNALRLGLQTLSVPVEIRHGTIRSAIAALQTELRPGALIVDLHGEDKPLRAVEELFAACPPDVRVLVVGEDTSIPFYRTLTHQLGVTEFLWKPLTRDNVERLFAPALGGGTVAQSSMREGAVILVCGARGGVGTTTIAVNTALGLVGTTPAHVVLLDLHLQGGTVGLMLGLKSSTGLRIALENPDHADTLFLDRVSVTVQERLRVVAAEEPFDLTITPSAAGVARVLSVLRSEFNYVVVDLPMPPPPAMRNLIASARHVVVVLQPDVAGLRDAAAIRRLVLADSGSDRTLFVLNRANLPGALSEQLVEEGLGRKPGVLINDLGRPLLNAANLGTPAIVSNSAMKRAISRLIRDIAGVDSPVAPVSWLQRLTGR